MLIIDRYLLRQFVQTFLICFLSLTGVFVVFDSFTNLDSFVHAAKGMQLLKLMGAYYAYQSVFFFDRTCSLLVLMSAMFTVAWIQRHHEMTALLAAGISRIRVVAPVIAAAVIIILFSALNREAIMPRFRERLAQRPGDLKGGVAQELSPEIDNDTDVLIAGKAMYPDQQRIERPKFVLPPALVDYGKQLVADNAYYRAPEGNRPGGYLFEGMQEPKNLAKKPSLLLGNRPVLITPRDAPDWLKPDQCFLVSEMTFDYLNDARALRMFASTGELIRSLRNPNFSFRPDIRVQVHSRMVQPLLDLTLFFLGLPLVVSRESRNVFLAIGLCMGVVTLFLLVGLGFQQLGAMQWWFVTPALAAWAPLMLFAPAAVGLSESMWVR
jgi:lipopolysaccharide export system permease protein